MKKQGLFYELVKIMAKLRLPKGCPWDKHQTHHSLKKYLREETREVLEAIAQKDIHHLKEELGDLLLQIVFHAQIAKENGEFTIDDVIQTLIRKLKRRHPHVFSKVKVKNAAEVIANWNKIKLKERNQGL